MKRMKISNLQVTENDIINHSNLRDIHKVLVTQVSA